MLKDPGMQEADRASRLQQPYVTLRLTATCASAPHQSLFDAKISCRAPKREPSLRDWACATSEVSIHVIPVSSIIDTGKRQFGRIIRWCTSPLLTQAAEYEKPRTTLSIYRACGPDGFDDWRGSVLSILHTLSEKWHVLDLRGHVGKRFGLSSPAH